MHLRGQHGYAMVALIVGMAVAAVLMTAVMPVWSQMARREKEEELVFRGRQYARAIGLFQRKSGPGVLPPSVDVLVSQRFLRKKYKDPITGKDFAVLSAVAAPAGPGRGGRGNPPQPPSQPSQPPQSGFPTNGRGAIGGVMGVASTSTDESLRQYDGRTHYNEWQFVYVAQSQAPGTEGGGSTPGGSSPGGLSNPPGGPSPGTRGGGDGGRGIGGRGASGGGMGGPQAPLNPRGGGGMPGGLPPRQ